MNNIEKGILPIEQPSERPKDETPVALKNSDSERLALEAERMAKERDKAKIAEIRASLGLEQTAKDDNLQKYLQERLDLKEVDVERVGLLKAKNLPKNYKTQYESLNDKRLENISIAVVPDDLWVKGSQPSESSAEKQLILIKQSYYEAQENSDEIAWMIHELAHCQNFLDSESAEAYQKNMRTFAFEDMKTKYPYPNNPVEQFAFTKQFHYLKEQDKGREDILKMLGKYYDKEDFPFFNRLLDGVYS